MVMFPSERLKVWQVDQKVGNVSNTGANCPPNLRRRARSITAACTARRHLIYQCVQCESEPGDVPGVSGETGDSGDCGAVLELEGL
jgi:hypothetical protein